MKLNIFVRWDPVPVDEHRRERRHDLVVALVHCPATTGLALKGQYGLFYFIVIQLKLVDFKCRLLIRFSAAISRFKCCDNFIILRNILTLSSRAQVRVTTARQRGERGLPRVLKNIYNDGIKWHHMDSSDISLLDFFFARKWPTLLYGKVVKIKYKFKLACYTLQPPREVVYNE